MNCPRDLVLLSKSCRLLLFAVALSRCSKVETEADSDWMLGTFSARFPGDSTVGLSSVGHYEFREDGTLRQFVLTGCQANFEEPIQEYKWRRAGESRVPGTG
jgi:hypothetical protein